MSSCAIRVNHGKFMLDDADRRILRHLLAEPEIPRARLAERAGVTMATLSRRLERLRADGVLKGEGVRIDWRRLGWGVEVSLRFMLDKTEARAPDEFTAAARKVPEVIEIQTFLGSVDMRLSVIARDMADWQRVYRDHILTLPHVTDIEPLMLVSTIKDAEALPL